jgi:hypothetical protein
MNFQPVWDPGFGSVYESRLDKIDLSSTSPEVIRWEIELEKRRISIVHSLKIQENPNEWKAECDTRLVLENDGLYAELKRTKARIASLLDQLRNYESLKSCNQALAAELANTQQLLDYMIEQKDERLKDMAVAEVS